MGRDWRSSDLITNLMNEDHSIKGRDYRPKALRCWRRSGCFVVASTEVDHPSACKHTARNILNEKSTASSYPVCRQDDAGRSNRPRRAEKTEPDPSKSVLSFDSL